MLTELINQAEGGATGEGMKNGCRELPYQQ